MHRDSKPPTKGRLQKLLGERAPDDSQQTVGGETPETECFPIYILHLDPDVQIVFPENRKDLDHPDFWEQLVCHLVTRHFGIPPRKLANLPYCQRRARIVGNKVYYGETHDPALLRLICDALGNSEFVFCYDDHEKRLPEDVRQFIKLARSRRPT